MSQPEPDNGREPLRVRLRRILGAQVLAAALALLAVNAIVVARHCHDLRSPAAGMMAPDFTLPSTTGESVRLSALRGQVLLIDFWATWCPPCREKIPLLKELQRDFGPRGFRVLAVNTEADPIRVKGFVRQHGLEPTGDSDREHTITTLLDDGHVAAAYGVQTIPDMVVVGRDGRIVHVHIGTGGQEALRDRVRVALAAPRRIDERRQ